jgi:hypothetical protein
LTIRTILFGLGGMEVGGNSKRSRHFYDFQKEIRRKGDFKM